MDAFKINKFLKLNKIFPQSLSNRISNTKSLMMKNKLIKFFQIKLNFFLIDNDLEQFIIIKTEIQKCLQLCLPDIFHF